MKSDILFITDSSGRHYVFNMRHVITAYHSIPDAPCVNFYITLCTHEREISIQFDYSYTMLQVWNMIEEYFKEKEEK